jgi:sialic acid synthase SpsE
MGGAQVITLPSDREIGHGLPPFIIAEVGSNWRTLDDCKLSIAMAKRAGADAVKFQAFTHEALYGRTDEYLGRVEQEADLQGIARAARIAAHELPPDWLPILASKAKDTGIEFMCSAFSPELVRAVDPYVNLHKVASAELTHLRILEAVRETGKPVILSTGASGPDDVSQALSVIQRRVPTHDGLWSHSDRQVILMYCVAAYPARDIDFRMLDVLGSGLFPSAHGVGYSDHTTDYGVIPRAAVERGACVLEKHFTAIEADTPDRPHSLTVDEFRKMVQSIKGERPFAWGSCEEKEMQLRHNRRLIATCEIKAGQMLIEGENFGIYRSLREDTRGLSGFAAPAVDRRVATKAIQAGDAIGPGDFE